MLSKVTSIDEGGIISPAMVVSYSSNSRSTNWAGESPVFDSIVCPFCLDFLLLSDDPEPDIDEIA